MDVSTLYFRTYAHATEDAEKALAAMKFASGQEDIETRDTSGFHGNPIKVLEVRVKRGKDIDGFFRRMDKEDVEKMLVTAEKRMDEDSFFFLRLDKQEAYLGHLKIADHDDVIAVRAKVTSYPKSKEGALRIMKAYLNELMER